MKVYYWTPYMEQVGTIKATINSAIALKKRGYDVKIYKLYREWEGYEEQLEKYDIGIVDLGLKDKFKNLSTEGVGYRISMILLSIFGFSRLKKSFEEEKPDVVIANLLGYLPLLVREHSKYKPKMISSIQGKPCLHRVRRILWNWLYAKTDLIITLTDNTRKEMIEKLNLPEEKFVLLPNPIIDETMEIRANEQVEMPFSGENVPVILGVGRLTRQKDFSTLLRAIALVKEKQPVKLIILGEGEEEEQLKKLSGELGIEEDVWMPGFVKNPFAYMVRADLFVLSSLWEDAGHVLVEAAYMGIPIVSTRCPYGQEEFLKYGEAGLLCEVGDASGMAEAILNTLAAEPAEKQKRIACAKQQAMRFHIDGHGMLLEEVIKEL